MTTGTPGRAVRAGAAALCGLAAAFASGAHCASAVPGTTTSSPVRVDEQQQDGYGLVTTTSQHPTPPTGTGPEHTPAPTLLPGSSLASTGTDAALPALAVGFAALLIGVAATVALHRRSGGHR
jgi:hypothetical protein